MRPPSNIGGARTPGEADESLPYGRQDPRKSPPGTHPHEIHRRNEQILRAWVPPKKVEEIKNKVLAREPEPSSPPPQLPASRVTFPPSQTQLSYCQRFTNFVLSLFKACWPFQK